MSSLRCVRCHEGFIVPTNPIGTRTPLQETKQVKTVSTNTDWACTNCQHRYRLSLIATSVSLARDLFSDVDKSDTRAMEALLRKLLRTFTPQHFVILEVKQALVAAYRDMIIRQPNPTRNILNRKTELCQDMLPVLQVVEPGISRLRGITFPSSLNFNASQSAHPICVRFIRLLKFILQAYIYAFVETYT
jgi:hypothetical protein